MQASASAPTLRSESLLAHEDRKAETMVASAGPSDDVKARSAALWADPKMKELKHFTKSHQHETRLREAANLETRPASSAQLRREPVSRRGLRSEGCEEIDHAMKKLSKEEATLPYVLRTTGLPESFRPSTAQAQLEKTMDERLALLRRMDRFQTRLTWRDSMDHSLKRLLMDMELSREDCLKEYQSTAGPANFNVAAAAASPTRPRRMSTTSHTSTAEEPEMVDQQKSKENDVKKTAFCKARVEHLEKVYDWYVTHGMKEVRKERKAPPYLKYNPDNAVMPGSLRVAPQSNFRLADGKGHSSSSPALLAGGAAAMDGGQVSRAAAPL